MRFTIEGAIFASAAVKSHIFIYYFLPHRLTQTDYRRVLLFYVSKMEMLQTQFDNLFANACTASCSEVSDCSQRGCSYYDASFLSSSVKEEEEIDDAREDLQPRSDARIDDAERLRLADEEPNEFSLTTFLKPLLPFAYIYENDANDDIFKKRPILKGGNSELSNLTLYRCHAWSSKNLHSQANQVSLISFKDGMDKGLVSPDVSLAEKMPFGGHKSELLVLYWDEQISDSCKIILRQ